jgi:hypothetical protein
MINVAVLWEVVTQEIMLLMKEKRYLVIIILVRMNNVVFQMLNVENLMTAYILV